MGVLPCVERSDLISTTRGYGRRWKLVHPPHLKWRWLRSHLTLQEISGSLGDLGTFLPILVALAKPAVGVDAGTSLFFAGMWNILTGFMFGIPMPVQPMKSIATAAITEGMTVGEIMTAGILTSSFVLVLGVTGLIGWINTIVPLSVVRGLQVGLGISLISKAITKYEKPLDFFGWDSNVTGALTALFVFSFYRSNKAPTAIVLFVIGLIFAGVRMDDSSELPSFGWNWPTVADISADDWLPGFTKGAVPQIPLTTMNSVVAVCKLSEDLFPERKADVTEVSISVALMNLVSCWFGGMPMCHGAGGLAGQYKFGARSNMSIIVLGIGKLLLGIVFGSSITGLMEAFPNSILGVMLCVSGLELATAAKDQSHKDEWTLMLITAGASVAFNSTAAGFGSGMAAMIVFVVHHRITSGEWAWRVILSHSELRSNDGPNCDSAPATGHHLSSDKHESGAEQQNSPQWSTTAKQGGGTDTGNGTYDNMGDSEQQWTTDNQPSRNSRSDRL